MKKGDIIEFGKYPQGADGSVSPIEWIVLDVNENEALLISLYGLNRKEYHNELTNIIWEDCDLRRWFNSDFLKYAFSEEEFKIIKFSELKNEDNRAYQTKGGNNTKDRVFCLSIDEAKQYFSNDKNRLCQPTVYAQNQGVYNDNGSCYWWLRSPGYSQRYATYVGTDGALYPFGDCISMDDYAVRPALRIIL